MDANKEKALAAALTQIERQFGKGTVMRMGDSQASFETASDQEGRFEIVGLPTGRFDLDGETLLVYYPFAKIAEQQRLKAEATDVAKE